MPANKRENQQTGKNHCDGAEELVFYTESGTKTHPSKDRWDGSNVILKSRIKTSYFFHSHLLKKPWVIF